MSFWVSVFIFEGQIAEVKLLDHEVVLFLFWGNSILFSIVAVPIYIPTNSEWRLPILHIFANTCCLLCFWWQPFWEEWSDISLWFWLAFLWLLVMLSIISCVCWTSGCLWKNVYSDLLPILKLHCLVTSIKLYRFFLYFRYWLFIRYMICKYFLSLNKLPFHFVDACFCCAEAF